MNVFLGKSILITLVTAGCLWPTIANAQAMDRPWSFSQQNRASIAALMRQVERGASTATTTSSSASILPQDVTSLVCGSDGSSSAKGNSSCIILNNATGDIMIGQDSLGDQTASSNMTEEINVDETINTSNADDVLATLEGE